MRTSMGDVQLPKYDLWTSHMILAKEENSTENLILLKIIINCIWGLWMLQIISMFVININLVIAVLGQSYDKVMDTAI